MINDAGAIVKPSWSLYPWISIVLKLLSSVELQKRDIQKFILCNRERSPRERRIDKWHADMEFYRDSKQEIDGIEEVTVQEELVT